jgi:hypothetical protein
MALKTSGFLRLSEIQGEFGGDNPISMSEYYRSGIYVPDISINLNIPTSSTINVSDFYGSGASVSSFTITASTTSVNEGDSVTFTINTSDSDGTLYWTLSTSDLTNSDFTSPANAVTLGGSVLITGNTGTVDFTLNADSSTEGIESFRLTLRRDSTTGTQVAQSSLITVNDTSQGPTYDLTGPASVNEGTTLTIVLNTTNVSDGTSVGYTITGITADDLSSGSLTGSFVISNNTASVALGIAQEAAGNDYLIFGGIDGYISRFNLADPVTNSTYVNQIFTTDITEPLWLHFKNDGLAMYLSSNATGKTIRQFPLTDPYNPGSWGGSANMVTRTVTPTGTVGGGTFSPIGTRFYWSDRTSKNIYQHTLFTNWDISQMSTGAAYTWVVNLPLNPIVTGVAISTDGTKMFIASSQYARIYAYTLPSPYNIGPSSPAFLAYFVLAFVNPRDLKFNGTGTKMFVTRDTHIDQYNLTTAWDINTASYSSSIDVSGYDAAPNGLFVSEQAPEGNETLRLSLNNNEDFIDVTVINVE